VSGEMNAKQVGKPGKIGDAVRCAAQQVSTSRLRGSGAPSVAWSHCASSSESPRIRGMIGHDEFNERLTVVRFALA
jgi:hypothetical protein